MDKNELKRVFLQTRNKPCELERRKQKEKEQEAVGAAVQVQIFDEKVEPQEHPALFAKKIGLTSGKDTPASAMQDCKTFEKGEGCRPA